MDVLAKKQLINAISEDSLIMFVGAGVSNNSNLPTWGELINSFAEDLELDISNSKDYLRIAQYYYDTFGQNQYMKKIKEVFNSRGVSSPNELHRLIEKIAPKHIITTNYDSLLENQFENGLLKYSVVAEDKDIPYARSEKYLVKMHGDFEKKNIVLKEDDYLDYHKKFPMTSTLIQSLIMNHTLLFVGYSLNDSTFNSIFRLIQSSFDMDAKVAFFYTPENISEIVRDYYKKKGIIILSNDDNTIEVENRNKVLYDRTKKFLEELAVSRRIEVNSPEELWNQLSFLDKLNFIDYRDFFKYSNVKNLSYFSGEFKWAQNQNGIFELKDHKKLKQLIEKKSIVRTFCDLNFEEKRILTSNEYLKSAYKLYKEKNYTLAKAKFRELANSSYRKKDYFTFLLCEFNFKHIHPYWNENENYQEAVYSEDLSYLTQQIIDSETGNDKKIIEYFRDSIFNMSFLDRKLERINELFDKVREDHELCRSGGLSYNSYLWNANFEIRNLQHFLNLNCICVEQYKTYKAIINRYFEILLLSYDNSNLPSNSSFSVSSVVNELELEDIEILLPNINLKMLSMYLRNYSFSKIRITEEARNYLFDRIDQLQHIGREDNLDIYSDYKLILSFLTFLEYDNLSKIIEILDKQFLYFDLNKEVNGLLKILVNNQTLLNSESDKNKIVSFVKRHIDDILNNNLELHEQNFYQYAELLKICVSDDCTTEILVDSLEDDIFKVKSQKKDIAEFIEYADFLIYFFEFLKPKIKESIIVIFSQYEEMEFEKKNYHEIIKVMLSGIYEFPKIQNDVYTYLINKINIEDDINIYPNPVKESLSMLFNLKYKGYFDEKDYADIIHDIRKDIRGIFPEVDWVWFNDRTDEVMERLLENISSSNVKEYFAKTDEDRVRLDDFIIKMLDEGKAEFRIISKR